MRPQFVITPGENWIAELWKAPMEVLLLGVGYTFDPAAPVIPALGNPIARETLTNVRAEGLIARADNVFITTYKPLNVCTQMLFVQNGTAIFNMTSDGALPFVTPSSGGFWLTWQEGVFRL